MVELLAFAILIFASVLAIFTRIIWDRINLSWLQNTANLIILSLPFERIPSLDSPLGTIKIGQLLVFLGMYFWLVLLIKQDRKLAVKKLDLKNLWLLSFLIFSSLSWFDIFLMNRFLSSLLGTLVVFGAFFLVSNFATKPRLRIIQLTAIMIFVSVFGWYQLLADFVGFPLYLTGLRANYTKAVFGIARIQATAIEPGYFALMLYLPIFVAFMVVVNNFKFSKRINTNFRRKLLLTFFLLTLVFTLSKIGYAAVAFGFATLFALFGPRLNLVEKSKKLISQYLRLIPIFLIPIIFINRIQSVAYSFWVHLLDTFSGQAATVVEREDVFNQAIAIIQQTPLIGIGPGQFGYYVSQLSNKTLEESSDLIVNNAYLEVWVESGFLALASLLILVGLILFEFYISFIAKTAQSKATAESKKLFQVTDPALFIAIICCLVHWLIVSPVYIAPIFILLGLAANIIQSDLKTEKV